MQELIKKAKQLFHIDHATPESLLDDLRALKDAANKRGEYDREDAIQGLIQEVEASL